MNPLAQELNHLIASENPLVLNQLSRFGKEIFFPKGILTQTAEAKEKAHKYNATLGMASADTGPLVLASFEKYHRHLKPEDVFYYAPSPGKPSLRRAWKKRMVELNPSLQEKVFSLPVVTAGLTHGLSLVADLFFDEEEVIIFPDQIWGNYNLIFKIKKRVQTESFSFYKNNRLNLDGLKDCMQKIHSQGKALKILCNFPNNPTGYALTKEEARAFRALILEYANKGAEILLIFDDAYFGLFFEDLVFRESLFTLFQDAHENIFSVKLDAITKEYFAWGYRIGFMTFGCKGLSATGYASLEKKAGGAIRGSLSNCSMAAQSIVEKEINSGEIKKEVEKNVIILKNRANKVRAVLKENAFGDQFEAYPFNAGYFMLIRLKKIEAEKLRSHLLERRGVGTIATAKYDLRIAFSCVEERDLEDLFKLIYKGCGELS